MVKEGKDTFNGEMLPAHEMREHLNGDQYNYVSAVYLNNKLYMDLRKDKERFLLCKRHDYRIFRGRG